MPIDINGLPNNPTQISGDRNGLPANEREPVNRNLENGRSSVQDTVSFSETAIRMGRLGAAMDDTPVVDTQRVEQARQALADGTYKVDAQRIAEKLMQFDDLLARDK
jgi:negative regulator of flagellin synthesis FlgM